MPVEADLEMLTLADLVESLGGVPLARIRLKPTPGTATDADLIEVTARAGSLFELVDGTLVEKAMGFYQARVTAVLICCLELYFRGNRLGFTLTPDGMVRTQGSQVRLPDVSVFLWQRFPGRTLPQGTILGLCPDVAIEVLSDGNTPREMERKRREYFGSGARAVWEIDVEDRCVRVYSTADDFVDVDETGTLESPDILPGFSLAVAELFAEAGPRA